MVSLTFKNVGQGDSIILEWADGRESKIAIIDCNLYEGRNPVLDHIVNAKSKEIEFVLLTHPHLDHFSGFHELLTFCQDNNIVIKRFLHTSELPDFLKSASESIEADDELFKLFNLVRDLRKSNHLNLYVIDDNDSLKIPVGSDFHIEVLSPSSQERDNYKKGIVFPFNEEGGFANPNANWLSTILKLYNKNYCIILTSDVEASSLTRIGKKSNGRIGRDILAMAQLPHHGSKGNLNKKFWQFRKRHSKTPVVISVGENGYKHPSQDVIEFFTKQPNYFITSTNMSGALSKINERTQIITQILNIVSTNNSSSVSSLYNGDKVFNLYEKECKLI